MVNKYLPSHKNLFIYFVDVYPKFIFKILDKTNSNKRKNVRFSDGFFPGQTLALNEKTNLGIILSSFLFYSLAILK